MFMAELLNMKYLMMLLALSTTLKHQFSGLFALEYPRCTTTKAAMTNVQDREDREVYFINIVSMLLTFRMQILIMPDTMFNKAYSELINKLPPP